MLHFGAVDYHATVWVNGHAAAEHEGGYTPFCVDITDFLNAESPQTIVVCAEDDPADLSKPRGKQDWQLEPHSIWYPRTTGIWQTVWMERVPATYIGYVRWTPNVERWEIGFEAWLRRRAPRGSPPERQAVLRATALLADDTYAVVASEVHRRIALSDPGIDDYRNELLWSPATPTLIHAEMQAVGPARRTRSTRCAATPRCARSACRAISSCSTGGPIQLRMVLDQGYWPESGPDRAR